MKRFIVISCTLEIIEDDFDELDCAELTQDLLVAVEERAELKLINFKLNAEEHNEQ